MTAKAKKGRLVSVCDLRIGDHFADIDDKGKPDLKHGHVVKHLDPCTGEQRANMHINRDMCYMRMAQVMVYRDE